MRHSLVAALAAALVVGTTTAQAQDSTRRDTTRQESRGDVTTAPTFASVIAALNTTTANVEKLKGMTDLTAANVRVVDAATLAQGNDAQALQQAIEANQAAIDSLRAVVTGNPTLSGALAGPAGTPTPVTDIIGVDIGPTGNVVLFTYKRP